MDYPGKLMTDRYEQVQLYSKAEFARRRDCILNVMKENDIRAVWFTECAEEAYDEWLTGRRYLENMLVTDDGRVLGIRRNMPADIFTAHEDAPDVHLGDHFSLSPYMDAEQVIAQLKALNVKRLGVVLPVRIKAALFDALCEAGIECVDVSIPVALERAVKSKEEYFVMKQAADIQKKVFYALPQMIREGRVLDEVCHEIWHMMASLGASGVVHGGLICNGPQEKTIPDFAGLDRSHRIERGDRFFTLFEANGPGHHHAAFGRHLLFKGELREDWEKSVSDAAAIHDYAVSLMKPGKITLREIAARTQTFANDLGYTVREEHGWNWMHSMGGYYYEQYSLQDYTDDIPLRSNIVLHCHPLVRRLSPEGLPEDMFILNTYFINEDGAEDLFNVPKGPILI